MSSPFDAPDTPDRRSKDANIIFEEAEAMRERLSRKPNGLSQHLLVGKDKDLAFLFESIAQIGHTMEQVVDCLVRSESRQQNMWLEMQENGKFVATTVDRWRVPMMILAAVIGAVAMKVLEKML